MYQIPTIGNLEEIDLECLEVPGGSQGDIKKRLGYGRSSSLGRSLMVSKYQFGIYLIGTNRFRCFASFKDVQSMCYLHLCAIQHHPTSDVQTFFHACI